MTTRQVECYVVTLYFYPVPWSHVGDDSIAYTFEVYGTSTGKNGSGDTWTVEGIYISPSVPEPKSQSGVLALLRTELQKQIGKEPRGLAWSKIEGSGSV